MQYRPFESLKLLTQQVSRGPSMNNLPLCAAPLRHRSAFLSREFAAPFVNLFTNGPEPT